MQKISFSVSSIFAATCEEVFDALTNPKKLIQWQGKGFISHEIGGEISLFDGWVKGMVLDFKPGESFAYTWRPEEWLKDWEDSEVRFTFSPLKKGTKVTVTHSKLPNATEAKEHKLGWSEYVFEPLKEYLAIENT